jgi:hypothetical protein
VKTRNCPKCTRSVSYSRDRDCERANRHNSICIMCKRGKIPTRTCPKCNTIVTYATLGGFKVGLANNSICKKCNCSKPYYEKGSKRPLHSINKQMETYQRNKFFKTPENTALYKSLEMKWED